MSNKMRELIAELWESDEASALTNRAARALEAVLTQQPDTKELESYLKDGETPLECIKRNRKDMFTAVHMLAEERKKVEALQDQVNNGAVQQPESEPVAWMDEEGCLHTMEESARFRGLPVTPLYTNPQPTPQVPEDKAIELWKDGYSEAVGDTLRFVADCEHHGHSWSDREKPCADDLIDVCRCQIMDIAAAPSIAEKEK